MNKHIFNRAMLGYEFVLFSGFFSIIYFVTVDEDIVYKQVYTIMSLVLLIIMLIGYGIWMKWEMFGRCNFESRRLLAEIFKGKGIRSIKNKLLLLSLYILLGYQSTESGVMPVKKQNILKIVLFILFVILIIGFVMVYKNKSVSNIEKQIC